MTTARHHRPSRREGSPNIEGTADPERRGVEALREALGELDAEGFFERAEAGHAMPESLPDGPDNEQLLKTAKMMRTTLESLRMDIAAEHARRGIPDPFASLGGARKSRREASAARGKNASKPEPPATSSTDEATGGGFAPTAGLEDPSTPEDVPDRSDSNASGDQGGLALSPGVKRQLDAGDVLAQRSLCDALIRRAAMVEELKPATSLDALILDHALSNLGRHLYYDTMVMRLLETNPTKHLDFVERFERLGRRAEAAFLRALEVLATRTRQGPRIAIAAGAVNIEAAGAGRTGAASTPRSTGGRGND